MKKISIRKAISFLILTVIMTSMALYGTVMASTETEETVADGASIRGAEFVTFDELCGKTISMVTGAPFEDLISSHVKEVKEFTYFQSMPDMMLAVETGKTDAAFMNNAVAVLAVNRNKGLAIFPSPLGVTAFGLGFKKGDGRSRIWQEVYDGIPEETKKALWEKWTGSDESKKVMPVQDWPGNNGVVRVAACDSLEPMSYMGQDGQLMGLDVETILMIAKELDVRVEFTPMDFAAALSSIGADKADIACGSIVITAERMEAMDFVNYLPAQFVLIVRAKDEGSAQGSFIDNVKAGFEKTFIREDRYKMFLSGICTTVFITVLSILFGTLLGFAVYMACRRGNRAANAAAGIYVRLIQGMPVVVLLMILYYIIFAKSDVSGDIVAVISFTLVFGAGVYGMLKTGVGAVDRGQTEAAYALGYGDIRTFFRIILPQAVPHFMPAYKGEAVALVKATAIVGYIAVQDLTKMGDVIRGRTYDAFFPLMAVAVIYFLLGGILRFLLDLAESAIDPKKRVRDDILKGVRTDD